MACVCSLAGVTILLSLTVFLLLVAEAMPATSDAIPLIGKVALDPKGTTKWVPSVLWSNLHRNPKQFLHPFEPLLENISKAILASSLTIWLMAWSSCLFFVKVRLFSFFRLSKQKEITGHPVRDIRQMVGAIQDFSRAEKNSRKEQCGQGASPRCQQIIRKKDFEHFFRNAHSEKETSRPSNTFFQSNATATDDPLCRCTCFDLNTTPEWFEERTSFFFITLRERQSFSGRAWSGRLLSVDCNFVSGSW